MGVVRKLHRIDTPTRKFTNLIIVEVRHVDGLNVDVDVAVVAEPADAVVAPPDSISASSS